MNTQNYKSLTKTAGKFEMEKTLTPFLCELANDGEGEAISCLEEGCGHFAVKFELTCEEWEQFNEGDEDFPFTWIYCEDSQGFAYTFTEDHYNKWIS
tara:strand:+ start:218 stop:508 length:291 start_codon:yes stop_codon:yes gene_type:complete